MEAVDRVPITFAASVPEVLRADVLAAPHVRRWLEQAAGRFDLRGVAVRDVVFFGRRVGFVLVEADAWHEGRKVPGAALLRGDAVSVLVVLHCPGHAERTILTCEPRLPVACPDLLALPAGMVDGGELVSTALRELGEEVGTDLVVPADRLVALATVWPSPGGCDEAVTLYSVDLEIGEAAVRALDGRRAGNAEEHESIRLRVVALDDLPRIGRTDAKTLLSYHLYRARAGGAETGVATGC
ncbi:nucleoside diphosphate hydrolase [Gluconacetobacter sacchari DSM 12717]|uniref:GDP-mannose pyrophosphatase n=2 Tax=Gluconacetobacter sacchari TaxID=92759 RepID=A0A7W4NRT8_9PROT|nr:NUDIX domain-containing protein [Gluconacetobacter sacchari]MBB2161338.1 NUDIX domain-containing protein [Gluconacetobacter sacchari]GBQ29804.1 nucleoside diphosphate hydrolase [Gluconacetobacter sacchari DSM 12717]